MGKTTLIDWYRLKVLKLPSLLQIFLIRFKTTPPASLPPTPPSLHLQRKPPMRRNICFLQMTVSFHYYIHVYESDFNFVDPTWASINRGVLICDECCSVHRSLGRHISQVKSLTKGQWSPTLLAVSNIV